ncbi:MAG: hypothetical protein Q9207_007556 [Kuettlingeria erythrocarpa]
MVAISPLRQTDTDALASSQQASRFIGRNGSAALLASVPFFTNETPEQWTTYESLLYSCLRTGDDKAARFFLDKLACRFGEDDERVVGLRGLYQEAMAEDDSALLLILHEYDEILNENPTNTPVRKRRIALLRGLSRLADAVNALVELLAASPTDIESWAELASLYASQGLYLQAEFCLEEILLTIPNAWNIHARLGEILYISAATSQDQVGALSESVRRFCRSIELCDSYPRASYGLKLVREIKPGIISEWRYSDASEKLIATIERDPQSAVNNSGSDNSNRDLPVPSIKVLQELSEKATTILVEAVRNSTHGSKPESSDLAFIEDALKSSTMSQER